MTALPISTPAGVLRQIPSDALAAPGEDQRTARLTLDRLLRLGAALWVGVMAGFFWSFTNVVMPGLVDTDPLAAMAAMQAINDNVRNAVFAVVFFGAPLWCLALIGRALVRRADPATWVALAAALVYLLGVFGVTFRFNVPLNEDLAALDPTLAANAPLMTTYIEDWTAWNDVRTIAAIIAFVVLAATLLPRRGRLVPDGSPA